MKKIQIINGPNLNLLGKREPTVYGNASFEDYLSELRARFPQCEISYYQSNVEGEIINKIHEVGFEYDGVERRRLYAYFHCVARCYRGGYYASRGSAYLECACP